METAVLNKRRKNIDLPNETLQKLSVLAASQGKSLKSFIEKILIEKAAKVKIEVSENPSPSVTSIRIIQQNLSKNSHSHTCTLLCKQNGSRQPYKAT